MGVRVVRIARVEVVGWKPPHELKIEFDGVIDAPVDDGFVVTAYKRRRDFLEAVGPTIEEAFERVFLRGAEATPDGAGESGRATPDGAGESGRATPDEAGESGRIEDIEL